MTIKKDAKAKALPSSNLSAAQLKDAINKAKMEIEQKQKGINSTVNCDAGPSARPGAAATAYGAAKPAASVAQDGWLQRSQPPAPSAKAPPPPPPTESAFPPLPSQSAGALLLQALQSHSMTCWLGISSFTFESRRM